MPNHFTAPDFDDDDDDELDVDDYASPGTPSAGRDGGGGGGYFSNQLLSGSRNSLFNFDKTPGGASAAAGASPSSAGSFTPAGAPSASYLGSSMMRGVTGTAKSTATASDAKSTPRKIFAGSTSGGSAAGTPLGRSIHGRPTYGPGAATRQPSRLNQVIAGGDEDEEEEDDEDDEEDTEGEDDEEDAEGDEDGDYEEDEEDEEGNEEEDDEEDDPFLELAQSAVRERAELEGRAPWMPAGSDGGDADGGGDSSDLDMAGGEPADSTSGNLLLFATPTVNERIRKEAEDIYRASVARSGAASASTRAPREYRYAAIAKGMHNQMGYASLVEAPELVRQTELQISRLYSEGVGAEDDVARLDRALAGASAQLVGLWQAYAESLPNDDDGGNDDDEEAQLSGIGPPPSASPFANAAYVATLALQVHHTRSTGGSTDGDDNDAMDGGITAPAAEPLTETMFRWAADYHNPYPEQVRDVLRCRPGPASHGMFWQTVFTCLLQGRVDGAIELLRAGGWETVQRSGVAAYSGQALANVERAVQETIGMLDTCPGKTGNWDIWSSEWTLFRIRAKGALDHLRRFAEGSGPGAGGSSRRRDDNGADGGEHTLSGLARRAESHVPWDIYENINIVFDIALGSAERILNVAEDWCAATLGLFGWWDESRVTPAAAAGGGNNINNLASSFRHSKSLAMSRAAIAGSGSPSSSSPSSSTFEAYLDRLTRAFRTATADDGDYGAGLEINTNRPLEVALACVFEDNPRGLIGLLRAWSLPVAAAVAEIASLGGWLPMQSSASALAMALGGLDLEDLEVLGVDPADPDESDGVKDNTLVQYAQALVNDDGLNAVYGRDNSDGEGGAAPSPATMAGWELAIYVLGRMNSSERAEETVGELVRTILKTLDIESGATVDKIWRLLADLGMASFAEEAAEHYGDLLTNESFRFGEAVWYYAVAHRAAKVREVMNLLISYSLIQSAAYPAKADLDAHLHRLLFARRATLEDLARRDLEAAEILGRMLSGYATLRYFYDVRDADVASDDESRVSVNVPPSQRRAVAAAALTAVIASADDNIRGGLLDNTRDAVVSQDMLLALLGEALVFTGATSAPSSATAASLVTAKPVLAAETVDVLLKAAEDLQSLEGSRVYAACDEFFQVVLASAPGGLRGSTPADLLRRTTSGLSAESSSAASSYVLTGSSMLASQLRRSMVLPGGGGGGSTSARGWDWRSGLPANTKAATVLQRLRLGLSQALARLWVAEADDMMGVASGLVGGGGGAGGGGEGYGSQLLLARTS